MEHASQILIVDDDDGLSALFEAVLSDAGYSVSTAGSGLEAIQHVDHHQPSVILLDMRMPGMDGIEAFREIRRRAPESRVIFMTGYAEMPLHLARRGGLMERLPTEEDLEEFLDIIQQACESKGALILSQGPHLAARLAEGLSGRQTTPPILVSDPYDIISRFEARPGQVVILEKELDNLVPMLIRELTPAILRLLLSRIPALPVSPLLAKPFHPEELLSTVADALAAC